MINQAQWEFCELGIDKATYDNRKKCWCYSCWVWYFAPDGKFKYQELATLDKPMEFNPWRKALGLLGGAGWELVSIQHGNRHGGGATWGSGDESTLVLSNKIAYLKRLAIPGIAVDEPKLIL